MMRALRIPTTKYSFMAWANISLNFALARRTTTTTTFHVDKNFYSPLTLFGTDMFGSCYLAKSMSARASRCVQIAQHNVE